MKVVHLVLVALLLSQSVAAAPYLQWGADTASSGWGGDAGPRTLDISYIVPLETPMGDPELTPPLIDGVYAYVLTPLGDPDPLITAATWRIDRIHLPTGETDKLATGPEEISTSRCFAKHGSALILGSSDRILRIDAATGDLLQAAAMPEQTGAMESSVRGCMAMRLGEDRLWSVSGSGGNWQWRAWSPNLATIWTADHQELLAQATPPSGLGATVAPHGGYITDIAAVDGFIAAVETGVQPSGHVQQMVWVLDDDGNLRDTAVIDGREAEENPTNPFSGSLGRGTNPLTRPPIIAIEDRVIYANGESLLSLNPDQDVSRTHHVPDSGGSRSGSLAVRDGTIYAAAWNGLAAIEHRTGDVEWQSDPTENPASLDMLIAGDRVYALSEIVDNGLIGYRLSVFDKTDGGLLEQFDVGRLPAGPAAMAIGEEKLLLHMVDGSIAVIGDTARSMEVQVQLSEEYPAVGALVTIEANVVVPSAATQSVDLVVDWGGW